MFSWLIHLPTAVQGALLIAAFVAFSWVGLVATRSLVQRKFGRGSGTTSR